VSIITRTTPEISHEGRHLLGLAYRFDHPSRVTDDGRKFYLEEFAATSVDRSLRTRDVYAVGILHPWSPNARTSPVPVGSVKFGKSADGLAFDITLARTAAGDDAKELYEIGALGDVSIGAKPIRHTLRPSPAGQVLRREEIALRELSLAPPGMGQHEDAKVLAMRAAPEIPAGRPLAEAVNRRQRLLLIVDL
jgi:phage head maturation protease